MKILDLLINYTKVNKIITSKYENFFRENTYLLINTGLTKSKKIPDLQENIGFTVNKLIFKWVNLLIFVFLIICVSYFIYFLF